MRGGRLAVCRQYPPGFGGAASYRSAEPLVVHIIPVGLVNSCSEEILVGAARLLDQRTARPAHQRWVRIGPPIQGQLQNSRSESCSRATALLREVPSLPDLVGSIARDE